MEILGLSEWNIVYAISRDVKCQRGLPHGWGQQSSHSAQATEF